MPFLFWGQFRQRLYAFFYLFISQTGKINGVSLRGGFSSWWTIFMFYPLLAKTKSGAAVVEINEQKSFDLLEITLVCLVINGAVG